MNPELIYKIVLTIVLATGTLLNMASIGQPRKPLSVGVVIGLIIVNSIIIYGLWTWA